MKAVSERTHDEERAALGAVLRELREQRGLTPEQAAEGLNRRPAYLLAIENGRRPLSLPDLRKLAQRYGASLVEVVGALERLLPR